MSQNPSSSAVQRSNPEEELNHATAAWLAQLPRNAQPKALVQRFPRIVNRIAALWTAPVACDKYLEQLMFDTRDNIRSGFPPEVALEIADLKSLMGDIVNARKKALNPNFVDIWDGLHG